MDPEVAVTLALGILDRVLGFIAHIKSQSGLTADEIMARADAQDLQNKEQIKALLAEPTAG